MEKKTGEIIVPTEPTNPPAKVTGFTFKSYDKKAGLLQFEIKNQDGSPTDLINATVRLFMYIYSGEEKKEFPIFDNQIITESYMQGIVKYLIPDMLLAYEGKVDANVYIDFPDGSHTDNLAFTFNIEKSIIDRDVQLNGEYYFKDFQQLLDGIKQETTDAVNEALTNVDSTIEKANQQINNFVENAAQSIDQNVVEVTEELKTTQSNIDTVSQNVVSTQNELTLIKDKMNQTNQQIGDLGKLKKMYSNSIDFGGYDYSGNPNLMANINADSFSQGTGALSVVDDGDEVVVTLDPNHKLEIYKMKSQPALIVGKTYTMSVEIMLEDDFTGDPSKIVLRYFRMPQWVPALTTPNTLTTAKGVWQKLTVTAKMTTVIDNAESWYILLYNQDANNSLSGRLRLRHAKLEEGSTATPYQPNLLDDPYWLGKAPLGENIANKDVQFPITTTEYSVYSKANVEDYKVNQKYVLTMKATKPATQRFIAYLNGGTIKAAVLYPVEGLTDTWQGEFTVTQASIDAGALRTLAVYQFPSETKGTVKIDWLKIEKGDTRTPNISQFKYFGEGLKDSDNPNDYSWNITPDYGEQYFVTKSSTEKGLMVYKNQYITTENWDDIQESGIYYCAGATGENMPVQGPLYGNLIVIKSAGVIIQQFLSNGMFYKRAMIGYPMAWNPWSKLASDASVVHSSGNESIDGFKDFRQTPTVNNVPVALDRFVSKTVKTTNTTDFTNESSVRFERDGRSVVANFSITNKSANFAGWKNLMAFPKGYTPTSLKDWGGTLANKTNRNPALSVYANGSGIVVMVSTTNLPENQECSGTVSYFTNDVWPNE
ncbi:BppU family phage baseplate upper protein [Enterococcus hirae]|uniref:BppU family phage baseplate upper protein n=3 Tax=Enterococcus TaxID=1350 RepID=UPI0009BFC768|nr:BppU family phage baseplate upper protein [Enterococcus hirae]EMF0052883.1 BppU family phage baseplate upper protein [Enterococcus hirae]EMF0092167.1 BppU family phage baseplate upper protein [Enterococcus hirae]EMF0102952.1 BppU family phage baseplate upper protein [Enterococcus hirae]EMF0574652.1 BppU family phage baseplate upper protein [Enterococcus hirae]MBA5250572.1 BppU family phage baseplate upper protein [Enterococcus hirae]